MPVFQSMSCNQFFGSLHTHALKHACKYTCFFYWTHFKHAWVSDVQFAKMQEKQSESILKNNQFGDKLGM